MTYRDPLFAARARISALEDLLDAHGPREDGAPDERKSLREVQIQLAEERTEHQGAIEASEATRTALEQDLEREREALVEERARRGAEVSLLRSKLEESERLVQNQAGLFEAEQTIQRAEAEAEAARLRQVIAQRDTTVRELREEIRVHLEGESREVRAFYEARVRAVGAELAETGTLARKLERGVAEAKEALAQVPPADLRDREGMVERELARRKVAIAEAEMHRAKDRLARLETELERITDAEATLAERRAKR